MATTTKVRVRRHRPSVQSPVRRHQSVELNALGALRAYARKHSLKTSLILAGAGAVIALFMMRRTVLPTVRQLSALASRGLLRS